MKANIDVTTATIAKIAEAVGLTLGSRKDRARPQIADTTNTPAPRKSSAM